jgi:hypothetical protein
MCHANFITDTASHSRITDNVFLPADYIKPCSRKDPQFNDCALKNGRDVIPRIVRGNLHTAHCALHCHTVLSAACFGENQIQQKTLVSVLIRMRVQDTAVRVVCTVQMLIETSLFVCLFAFWHDSPQCQGLLIHEDSRSHTATHQSG